MILVLVIILCLGLILYKIYRQVFNNQRDVIGQALRE